MDPLAILYPAETRFDGKLIQIKRFFSMKLDLQQCVTSDKYVSFHFENDIFVNRARSWLFEKYYNMCFVDKNPEEPSGGAEPLEDTSKWEHRIIQNVVWSRRTGHVVDTVLINGSDGDDSKTYFIDEVLLQMIRDSPHNQRQIKRKIVDPPPNDINGQPTESEQAGSDSDSDSSAEEENRHQLTATV